jgi:arylsulfatase A-like enzyme/cytochrome c-type biogenesis protein CcmH/NrfG
MARKRSDPAPVARPRRIGLVAALAAASLTVIGFAILPKATRAQPSILLVTIDTLRADHVGCYGAAGASTPTLDALAARGVRFATAVAHTPLTAPSHASILTGLLPVRHGVRDNGIFVLRRDVPTLAEAFTKGGYQTAAFVSGFPLDRRFGFDRGFGAYDDRLPHGTDRRRAPYVERTADATTDAALRFLARAPAPFFLWVHYFDPHAPYQAPGEFGTRFADRPYDGEIAFVDAQLSRLLAAVPNRDRVAVIVTADHGESLGEHGELTHGVFVYDATLRVPWIAAGPSVAHGHTSAVVARGVDVAPTLLDWAGLPPLPAADGRSLLTALRGRELPDAPAYAESHFAAVNLGWAPLSAWRTRDLKLIRAPTPELYDLGADPGERTNLAPNDARAAALAKPLDALLAQQAQTSTHTIDVEERQRLAALGYLGGGRVAGQPTARDPKSGIALITRLEQGLVAATSQPNEAIRLLSAVLEEDPRLPLALRYRAIALQNNKSYDAALRDLDALARVQPPTLEDLVLRAETLRLAGRAAEALRELTDAARAYPEAPDPDLYRARVLRGLHQRDEAAAAFEASLKKSPGSIEALRGRADLRLESGDVAGAAAGYREILLTDPHDLGALVHVGVTEMRGGDVSAAVAHFESALELDPDNAEALLDMAGALAKQGRTPEAVPLFERAIEAGGESVVALNGLGFARLESGDRNGARAALRRSLSLDPHQQQVAAVVHDLGRP